MPAYDFALGRELTSQEHAARIAAETVSNPVPVSITRFQFIQAVEATGRMNDLLTYINGLTGLAKQYWVSVQEVRRDDQEIEDARVSLAVSQGALDTVFRNALQYKR